ncbi:MAG: hypothetical protein EAZ28_08430 [Oscillatoriales cyanobacterium]|nr:MAG: hypothetical protein EAZ28_08430 [Oscillatoriales cyanobacterium]
MGDRPFGRNYSSFKSDRQLPRNSDTAVPFPCGKFDDQSNSNCRVWILRRIPNLHIENLKDPHLCTRQIANKVDRLKSN